MKRPGGKPQQETASQSHEPEESGQDLAAGHDESQSAPEQLRAGGAVQEALRHQLDFTRTITESLGEGVHALDNNGRVTFINPAAERMLGWTEEELLGRNVHETIHFQHADGTPFPISECPLMNAIRKGVAMRVEDDVFTDKHGRVFHVSYTSAPIITNGQIVGAVQVFRDTTQRRRAEQRQAAQYAIARTLSESETLNDAAPKILQSICESLDWQIGALWLHDREADVLRCVEVWHTSTVPVAEFVAATREHTFARGEGLPGRVWASGEPTSVTDVVANGQFWRGPVATRSNLHAGFSFPIRLAGEVLGVFEFFSWEVQMPEDDLLSMLSTIGNQIGQFIERKRAEANLQASEQRYRSLADAMPQIVWTARPDGYHDYYNRRWFEYTGLTPEQSAGWGWQPILHPDDVERCIRRWARSVQTGENYEIEYRFRRVSDKTYRWHLGRAFPMRNEQGQIVKWFGTSTDIDDQKRAEQERKELLAREQEARARAEEANRAKDEFLATLSHELRTPLTPIVGWVHMMRAGNLPPHDLQHGLAVIDRNSQSLTRIISDLLDMTAILNGKMRIESVPIPLHAVMLEAVETVRPQAAARRIELEVISCEDEEITINGDRTRLVQVFWNLLHNAIKFSPDGRRVRLRCEADPSEVRLIVEDEGQGMQQEFLPHAFERFRQADASITRKHGGLGIGLALVKSFIEAHGGSVTAESEGAGHGSRFIVRLPRLSSPVTITPLGVSRPETETRAASALIIEDSPDTLHMLQVFFESQGFRPTLCERPEDALSIASSTRFDIIISDIGMPGMSGLELIKRLRSMPHLKDVPAIALTGHTMPGDSEAALAAGFDAHTPKPVDPALLAAQVEQLVHGRSVDQSAVDAESEVR